MLKKFLFIITALFAFSAVAQDAASKLYHYRANVVSVYDGDTIRADMDLGLSVVKKNEPLRLYGINAPEVRGSSKELGYASRDYLKALLKDRELIVETIRDKKGKYGRYLAVLWVKGTGQWCAVDTWCNANEQMVKAGHAIEKYY